jgi:hypothetical protein
MIRVTFDGVEYFKFSSGQFSHNISENLAFKDCSLVAVPQEPFKDFITDLNNKNWMLAKVYVKDKLYLDGYINDSNFSYSRSTTETKITINIDDRFIGLRESDIIKTTPQGTIVNYLAKVLDELNYAGSFFINSYEKKIKTTKDLIALGKDVKDVNIKTFVRNDLAEYDNQQVFAEILSLANLILISNGYDQLRFEKTTTNQSSIFDLNTPNRTGISYAEKTGNNGSSSRISPSKVIILNSNDKTDNYTSVTIYNNSGIPHVQKIAHLNTKASYADIAKSADFGFAGIKARSNSFLYKIPNLIFDDQGDFFEPNKSVFVKDHAWGIEELMRILQVGFSIDAEAGIEMNLNVTTQEAFDNNASIKQKRALMTK